MIQRVAVVGAGTMGLGIAQLCAQSGFSVKVHDALPAALDPARLAEPAEKTLLAALERSRAGTRALWDERAYDRILPELLGMEEAIHAFFDTVLVNAEDAPTRLNRLRLLAEIRELFLRGWDLSKIVVEGERV